MRSATTSSTARPDGERVGIVAGAEADGIVVERAVFWRCPVPLGAVGDVDGQALRLAVTKDAVWRGNGTP